MRNFNRSAVAPRSAGRFAASTTLSAPRGRRTTGCLLRLPSLATARHRADAASYLRSGHWGAPFALILIGAGAVLALPTTHHLILARLNTPGSDPCVRRQQPKCTITNPPLNVSTGAFVRQDRAEALVVRPEQLWRRINLPKTVTPTVDDYFLASLNCRSRFCLH